VLTSSADAGLGLRVRQGVLKQSMGQGRVGFWFAYSLCCSSTEISVDADQT